MSEIDLTNWLPSRVVWTEAEPRIEWVLMEKERLLDPFYQSSIDRQVRKPFHVLFRRQTSMEEMCAWAEAYPGVPVRGLIFHVSRCGSTLISQQLAALEKNIVASEPGPLDTLLRAQIQMPELPRETLVRWGKAMVSALGQPRNSEQALYIKFDCWHIHQRDLIRDIFPDVPWIFLYRDPLRVLLSHQRMPAAWTVPGMLHPLTLGLRMEDWNPAETDVYKARALQYIADGGLAAVREDPRVMLVNYSELPQAMWGRLLGHFGLGAEDIAPMAFQAQFNAKSPGEMFTGDPKAEISERTREIVAEYLQPVYEALEAERLKQL